MKQSIRNFWMDQQGAALLEFALVAAMLGVALLDVLVSRGAQMSGELSQVSVVAK